MERKYVGGKMTNNPADVETDHVVLQQNAPAVLGVRVSAKLNILVPSRAHSQTLFSSSFI